MNSGSPDSSHPGRREFHTTHWSMVRAAGGQGSDVAADRRAALETLCETYWYPLYSFVRKQGNDAAEAADLTQGFFSELLRRDDLARVQPEKGRFRSFLLASLRHYIANTRDRSSALKRGGDGTGGQVKTFSLDEATAEQRYRNEPRHNDPPEAGFMREWAITVLTAATESVRADYRSRDEEELFNILQPMMAREGPGLEEAMKLTGKTAGAIKVAVHRLRQRFHEHLRSIIAGTVSGEDEIDAEINDLFEALRG